MRTDMQQAADVSKAQAALAIYESSDYRFEHHEAKKDAHLEEAVKQKQQEEPAGNFDNDDHIELENALGQLRDAVSALASFTRKRAETVARPSVSREYQQENNKERANQKEKSEKNSGVVETVAKVLWQASRHPKSFAQHYGAFAGEVLKIIRSQSELEPVRQDRRFRDQVWRDNPFYKGFLQIYLAWQKELTGWISELPLDHPDRVRADFILEQLYSAFSPSNTLLNPVSVKRAYQTGGQSILSGLRNMIDDLMNNGGMPKQTRTDAYTLGEDLATTPGAVIWRNEMLELIQYQPTTDIVARQPVLLIPPQINKYYIFDLSPENSLIRYLLDRGIQVYVVSWRIPTRAEAHWGMEEYIRRLTKAMAVVRSVSRSQRVNLISACAGGLTACSLLAYLAQTQRDWVASHSLFVTSLKAGDRTVLELFATPQAAERARRLSRQAGIMDGRALARIFAWMRPNDLVWSFWVNNYLLGKEPPSLDVLYWDNDSTRLPAALHSDFIDIYIKDAYVHPGVLEFSGTPIDLKKITVDHYLVGGTEDYIMPWQGCYESAQLIGGKCRFVLSSSGHIQSVLRPPGIAGTEYFTNDDMLADPDTWQAGAERHSGSWWDDWVSWLRPRSGGERRAPRKLGNAEYPPLDPAPGRYVVERTD